MNTILFRKEFKRDFKVFLILTIILNAFLAVTLSMYAAMKDSMVAVTELYSTMPEAFMEALNFQTGQWEHVLGFYATYFVYYVPMMTGAYAIYLGSTLLSREEHQRTAEFLMAKPITRNGIVSSKFAVLLSYILIPNILLWLNGVLWCGFIDSFSGTFTQVTIIHVYGLFICLFFGVLGYLVTILMKRAKSIVGPAIGIVMGMYFLDMIIRIADKAQFVLWFTPYKYMNIDLLNPEYHMEWWNLLVTGGATALMVGASYYFYSKKDILI